MERAAIGLKAIPDGEHGAFLGRLSKVEPGARQLIADAIFGITIARIVLKEFGEDGLPRPCPSRVLSVEKPKRKVVS